MHLRAGTRKTYGASQRKFFAFCDSIGVDGTAPLSEGTLCKAAIAFCRTCKVNSLPQYFAAIQKFHTMAGHGPLPRNEPYRQTCRALINLFGQVDRTEPMHALTLEDLSGIFDQLDLGQFEDVCFWACLTTAFFGLLRVSEYIDGRLNQQHVRVIPDQGVVLTIPFSKTSLHPVEVRLSARDDFLCPLKAIEHYQIFLGKASQEAKAGFFLAKPRETAALSKAKFIGKLKLHVKKLGLDPAHYSGHSCRRGGCTAMFLAGVSETFIAAHGR